MCCYRAKESDKRWRPRAEKMLRKREREREGSLVNKTNKIRKQKLVSLARALAPSFLPLLLLALRSFPFFFYRSHPISLTHPTMEAGEPAASAPGGTSRSTSAAEATFAFSPMRMFPRTEARGPIIAPAPTFGCLSPFSFPFPPSVTAWQSTAPFPTTAASPTTIPKGWHSSTPGAKAAAGCRSAPSTSEVLAWSARAAARRPEARSLAPTRWAARAWRPSWKRRTSPAVLSVEEGREVGGGAGDRAGGGGGGGGRGDGAGDGVGVHSPLPPPPPPPFVTAAAPEDGGCGGGGVGQGEGNGDESRGPGDEALLPPPREASEEVIVIRGERAVFAPPPPPLLLPLPSLLFPANLPRAGDEAPAAAFAAAAAVGDDEEVVRQTPLTTPLPSLNRAAARSAAAVNSSAAVARAREGSGGVAPATSASPEAPDGKSLSRTTAARASGSEEEAATTLKER